MRPPRGSGTGRDTACGAARAGADRCRPVAVTQADALRFIAFYLPQYHPIPENDEWWGPGFTEWTNVARAKPLFRGHYQPHIPADLGFYDLRLPEARAAQASLAAEHGIAGFCYYHYWFQGRRLLQRPFEEVLRSGRPDLGFCLCWANENWTRTWNGGEQEILVAQSYSPDDDLRHIRSLAEAFADPRYIRVDGQPLLLVYRASRLPEPRRTADVWRAEAERLGVGVPYLCSVQSFHTEHRDPADFGFDAAVEFAPDIDDQPPPHSAARRALRRFLNPRSPYRVNAVCDYDKVATRMLGLDAGDYKRYPCVTPGFDSTPRRRRGGARILVGSTPERYEWWLRERMARFTPYSPDENLFFVNAWNEWAEGNHLEPDLRWGRAYLDVHTRLRPAEGGGVPSANRVAQAAT